MLHQKKNKLKRLSEKKIWNKLNLFQKEHKEAYFCKIESPTMNGIPDVHCVFKSYIFWLELKANPGKNYGVSKYQIVWHLKYKRAGGNVFILNQPFVDRAPKLLAVEEPGVVLPVPVVPVPVLQILRWMCQ